MKVTKITAYWSNKLYIIPDFKIEELFCLIFFSSERKEEFVTFTNDKELSPQILFLEVYVC